MADNTFLIFKATDDELLTTFERVCEQMGGNGEYSLSFAVGTDQPQQLQLNSEALQSDKLVHKVRSALAFIFARISMTFPSLPGVHVVVQRGDGFDEAKLGLSKTVSHEHATLVSLAVQKHFNAVAATPGIEKLLGEEVAEFYRKREEGLLRLEGLSQRLIEENETYRRRLDGQHDDLKKQVNERLVEERNSLSKEYEKQHSALEKREESLEARLKDLDDRDSRHVRREIRQDLKSELAERNETFHLTSTTVRKRWVIHGLFGALLLVTGFMFVRGFIAQLQPPTGIDPWFLIARTAVSAVGFVAGLVFYIRWNNHWFQQHADEEFRLKRLGLDIDRASWVVEMALEWSEEKGAEIPKELIDRLTRNLFPGEEKRERAQHPSEDAVAALLAASSGLRIQTALGDFTLDKKGLQKLRSSGRSGRSDTASEQST